MARARSRTDGWRRWRQRTAAAAALLAGCGPAPESGYPGYAEGDYLLLAAPQGGTLQALHLRRGQSAAASAPAFELDAPRERAAVEESAGRLRAAEERSRNLRAPRRQRELDALRAQLAQAAAARALAAQDLRRAEELQPKGAVSRADLDTARRNHTQSVGREAELTSTLALAQQSIGRDAELAGALADVDAARAALAQAQWQLAQRAVVLPAAGFVQDTYFGAGEYVAAGRPVLSLLPPQNIKLRFFVPESALGTLKVGAAASVSCDGCGAPIDATVSHVSAQAEYTPPVLYSRDARGKLVFMVEARPTAAADAARLHPGQPVDVRLR